MKLSILYRGQLSSCNYGCAYCPFAKRRERRAELAADSAALARFTGWLAARAETHPADRISVLFTPWGEALIRRSYREAVIALSRLPNIARVAAQTNLSWPLDPVIGQADPARLALWCTWHPEWTTQARFLARCAKLDQAGVRYSVGMVGFRRFLPQIRAMRAALPPHVYLWVNAVKTEPYAPEDIAALEAIDPLFRINLTPHESLGRPCGGGESAISVDGSGDIRRCHFIREVIGNLYDDAPGRRLEDVLRPRPCTARTCGCHIGYVHMPELGLEQVFGEGLLERVIPGFSYGGA